MKKLLIELCWMWLGMASMWVWTELIEWSHDGLTMLIAAVLSLGPLTGVVIGFRKGFPDGIWGIK